MVHFIRLENTKLVLIHLGYLIYLARYGSLHPMFTKVEVTGLSS